MEQDNESCIELEQLKKKINVASGEDAGLTPAEYADYAWEWHEHEANKRLREEICA